ncbi:hypothetical protein [Catenovulum sediminis]|uniref:HEAT repeat domain-containing protein n=1 Tax=Catenovulum sediminis TaxID=1740262 RepID=A0ABV1RN85_9ALTE|nr:hypothetical protein [Catenovulum sediminis]
MSVKFSDNPALTHHKLSQVPPLEKRQSQPIQQNTVEKESKQNALSKADYYLQQMSESSNDNELLKKLTELLAEDEQAALEALKNLDYLIFSGRRIGRLLVTHFAQYPDIIDSISHLEMFKNSQAHFLYEDVAAGLLSYHASHMSPTTLIAFISQDKHTSIALKATPSVGRQMMKNKADSAWVADTIASMPNIKNKESLLYGALEQWLQTDPNGLLNYLSIQAHRPAYDRVISQYVHQHKESNPEQVLEWAEKIENPESRYMAIYATAQELARKSPETYRSWIAKIDEPELKSRIEEAVGIFPH